MLRYHVAFYLPRPGDRMVVAEALDFPGAVSQGFDLADARLMVSSALEDLAQMLLEEGKPLPRPRRTKKRRHSERGIKDAKCRQTFPPRLVG
jgi:predicted RNase H-like HicB family nuclease